MRYAMREEDFAPVFGAGVFLVAVGTIVYSLGNDWDVADGFYFSVATLTTTSVANPDLEIHDRWIEVFTAF